MRDTLHVALYVDSPSFYGAEQVARGIVSGLPDSMRVTLIGPYLDVLRRVAELRSSATVTVVPQVRNKRDWRSLLALRRALRALEADILHVNLTDMAACLPEILVAATVRDLSVVALEHHPHAPSSKFQRLVKRASVRLLQGHVAVSRSLAREVIAVTGERASSVRVIPNGLAPVEVAGTGDSAIVRFGVACRLERAKGLDILVDALALAERVQVDIVGTGTELVNLEAQSRAVGVADRVRFLGWTDDVDAFYRSIDVYVLPSRSEAMPLSVIEAMHHGLPVVAAEVGGLPELLEHGVTGLLVQPENPAALAAALEELRIDPQRRRQLAANALDRARSAFSIELMASRYAELYRDAAHPVRSGGRRGVRQSSRLA